MLHMPSFNLGRTLAAFDRAAGQVKTREMLLKAIVTIPESIEGFDTQGGISILFLSVLEGYEMEIARPRKVWWVFQYRVRQQYGGPEEGGWWYDAGDPTGEAPRGPFYDEAEADECCCSLNHDEQERRIGERYSYTSMLSHRSTFYEYVVTDERDAKPFPAEVPHYE